MKPKRDAGLKLDRNDPEKRNQLISYINIKLASLGQPIYTKSGTSYLSLARDLISNFQEKNRLLADYLPPADQRIQAFLDSYLADTGLKRIPRLPSNTFVLDRYGMARELSLPPEADKLESPTLTSYRVRNGVLNNPLNDRRTTKGVFHVAEGGLPVPPDKKAVPKAVFARLLEAAVNPPEDLNTLPFTGLQERKARSFLSLLIRPPVCPEVRGFTPERNLEVRFFAPGSLVSNLDFIESIFGNSGDPYVPENDSALDPLHWTGHTGCVILATHLTRLKKKDLGLPHFDLATPRQKRDGMCWKDENEFYNDGGAFKITARDERGIIVTLVADNYYGYSKKEVKTQISYSANLLGLAEEEHAGGALAFPAYNLGTRYYPDSNLHVTTHNFKKALQLLGDRAELKPEGYAVDKKFPHIIYLPDDATISLEDQRARWTAKDGTEQSRRVLPHEVYVHPSGYKVHMAQHPSSKAWRLVGITAEGTLCHKPCTVSGGGKSEISKSIWDAISFAPLFIADFKKDMDAVQAILDYDYSLRFKVPPFKPGHVSRNILTAKRSLGSVIKLLSPSPAYTDAYNAWLEAIPARIKSLVFTVKRFYQPEWGADWRSQFSVDVVNGSSGNILKYRGRPLLGSFLRVGFDDAGKWWTYKLRQDFMPAVKIQWEDDITASVVVPAANLTGLAADIKNPAVKFCQNAEFRFFQRPDDAVHRGYDKQAEADLAGQDNFISNFEPFARAAATEFVENVITFTEYTPAMQEALKAAVSDDRFAYFVVSSHPRIVDGAPSKNPRYLQLDPNLLHPENQYLADVGVHLFRQIPLDKPTYHPVNAVLPGRRNNPADPKAGIRPLAVYNPIHYQELPELFMEFIASLTGKSPSTTGAGTEGALTKDPFNALVATTDLNNALLSYILTDYHAFSTAAGYIGHKYRVDHDISLLVPELWARLTEAERDPKYLIENGFFEKVGDFEYKGQKILGSRLGYRMTKLFASSFLGRLFDNPDIVFSEEMLKPELQSMDYYADGINNIVEAQQKVARDYLEDGSVDGAIPPLKALLHIMAEGHYKGKTAADPEVRNLFKREVVLASDWYKERLELYQRKERAYLERSKAYLDEFLLKPRHRDEAQRLMLAERLNQVEGRLAHVSRPDYLKELVGSLGADVLYQGRS